MNDFQISDLLEADFSKLGPFIMDVLRNPTSNLVAFVLILAVFTIVMLMVIVALLLVFTGREDEEDEDYEDLDEIDEAAEARERGLKARLLRKGEVFEDEPTVSPAPAEPARELTPDEIRRNRLRRTASTLAWILIGIAVWMAGGWVSAGDQLCLSCHQEDAPHEARLAGEHDPHASIACVKCHETPSTVAVITTAVPARAEHYITSFFDESLASGYGRPVKNATCRACHAGALDATIEDADRGLRMSHAEPLEADALCGDCHVLRAGTGTVDRFTAGMEPCLRCHDAKQASAECSYCHTRDVAYAMRSRGAPVPASHVETIDCGSCHSQERCDACHGTRMPHTKEFMGSGHAREAVEDIWYNNGEMCERCHNETRRPCSRCHAGPFPSHPSPSFAKDHAALAGGFDPMKARDISCDNCHGYLQWITGRNFCGLCHTQYPAIVPLD